MKKSLFLIVCLIVFSGLGAQNPVWVQTELGLAFCGQNELRFPNKDNDSQLLSLNKDLSMNPKMDTRLSLGYLISPKHEIRLLITPKNYSFKGKLPDDMRFAELTLPSGSEVSGRYHHGVYRPSYRYIFAKDNLWLRSLGVSLNFSEYRTEIKSGGQKASARDFAFVPLINMDIDIPILEELSLVLEAEGMLPNLGRADDVFLGLEFMINSDLNFRTGYRYTVLGRETDKMHSIASFHSASIAFNISF